MDANAQWVLTGSSLLGLSSGMLGALALLRRRALVGDALAHAALPGICIAFLLLGTKQIGVFMVGAAVAGGLATLSINVITRYSRIKEDTALGLVLSVFFGVGILLLTYIQRLPNGNQAGLDKFLFGQAASLIGADVQVMVAVAVTLSILTALLFKEFKLLCFDPAFGSGLGFPMPLLDHVLMGMIVVAVVIGLQAVGVILMAAMLITPAAAARYWTERLDRMLILSGCFGAMSGAVGSLLSQTAQRLPTGPLIVLAATVIFLVSLLFAPRRGLVSKAVRFMRTRRRIALERVGLSLYELAESAGSATAAFTVVELVKRTVGGIAAKSLADLANRGIIEASADRWRLTSSGLTWAYDLVKQRRSWEIYLMYESDLGHLAVDRETDDITRAMPAPVRSEVERLLSLHGMQPQLLPERGREATS